jgi:hypothetical protein
VVPGGTESRSSSLIPGLEWLLRWPATAAADEFHVLPAAQKVQSGSYAGVTGDRQERLSAPESYHPSSERLSCSPAAEVCLGTLVRLRHPMPSHVVLGVGNWRRQDGTVEAVAQPLDSVWARMPHLDSNLAHSDLGPQVRPALAYHALPHP